MTVMSEGGSAAVDLLYLAKQNHRVLRELEEIRLEMSSVRMLHGMIERLQKIVDHATAVEP